MPPAHIFPKPESDRADDEPVAQTEFRPSGIHPNGGTRKTRTKWTVVKLFVREGHHYQLRRRPLELRGEDANLTKREEQVLACALAGQSNKIIAYNLGVAPSTVGVLLYRAATKLGVRSRAELLSAYARRSATSSHEGSGPSESESGGVAKSGVATNDGGPVRHAGRRIDPLK
jgi:DNA-binding CsgD family transcriptional regulator